MNVKLIAFDLDGTLLTSRKTLSPRTRAALDEAAARGILIVPTTGRLFRGMPDFIRALPYLRYAITVNGGQVEDRGTILHTAPLPLETAFRIYDLLDTMDVIYDCYLDGHAYMPRAMFDRLGEYLDADPNNLTMVRGIREPVDDFRGFLRREGKPLLKMQFFLRDASNRPAIAADLRRRFPETAVTYSMGKNVEINAADAVKGTALRFLCGRLGIPTEASMAFGDGVNDITMLEAAGTGVAMKNADPAVLAAADDRTDYTNDEDGVARYLETHVLL